ncbi:MAG: DUF2254 domain-containing protein [Alphaproteobacteria bacterium]|nr:DUF2254 domain-containing protein [Alphaproteobacteria bacterium]
MYLLLRSHYYAVQSNFWFIPALITLVALFAAPLALQADFHIQGNVLTKWLPGPALTPDGAGRVLSTIAGSMMTVASLVFSMTLVALSLISQQLGPRVLQFFMEDLTTKFVLGVFIGTFLFALIVLGTVGTGEFGEFVPRFSVFLTGSFAVFSFILMIYFVHHISTQIQADVVISRLGDQFSDALHTILKSDDSPTEMVSYDHHDRLSKEFIEHSENVSLEYTGYIASIDASHCLTIAKNHDLRVHLLVRPGQFILGGTPVLCAKPIKNLSDKVREELQAVVSVAPRRTREQHVEFEMNALVEVALRALSAGINDPYTAMTCIDKLSEGLAHYLREGPDLRVLRDDDDETVRVVLNGEGFDHYVNTALRPIRQAAREQPQVLVHLLQAIEDLTAFTTLGVERAALQDEVTGIEQTVAEYTQVKHDVGLLVDLVARVRATVASS